MGQSVIPLSLPSNNFSTAIDITSYTSTRYIFPSDGYLQVSAGMAGNTRAGVQVYSADDVASFTIGGYSNSTYPAWSTYVRKGMKAKTVYAQNGGKILFYPLVSGNWAQSSDLETSPITYTDGMWTVVKYDDGRAEVFGKKTFTNVASAQWATSGIYYIQLTPDAYPSGLFTSVTVAFAQSVSSSDFVTSARNQNYGGSNLSLTNPPQILGIRPGSVGSDTFTGMWHTIGRWK